MGVFDFLFPSAEDIFPITLILQAVLTIAFIVLAIIMIRFMPKGKIAGTILCIAAIIAVWVFL